MTSCRQIMTWSTSQLMADLEISGTRIPDAWSIILTFPLIAIFNFTKTENRTKKSHAIALCKDNVYAAKMLDFFLN